MPSAVPMSGPVRFAIVEEKLNEINRKLDLAIGNMRIHELEDEKRFKELADSNALIMQKIAEQRIINLILSFVSGAIATAIIGGIIAKFIQFS